MTPMVEIKKLLDNGQIPYLPAGPVPYEWLGTVYKISSNSDLLPGKSLSFPIQLPAASGVTVGVEYLVVHYDPNTNDSIPFCNSPTRLCLPIVTISFKTILMASESSTIITLAMIWMQICHI
jgi:hypothetical protein